MRIFLSSSSDQALLLISGLRWLCHLSLGHGHRGRTPRNRSPALLPDPAGQTLSDEGPLPRPVQTDELHDLAVLLVAPGSLGQLRVQDLRPPVQTLHLGLAREEGSDLLPVLPSVDIHRLAKNNVLADQSRSQISRDSPPSRSTWSSQTCECRA